MAGHPAHLDAGDGQNDSSRRPSELGAGLGSHTHGLFAPRGPMVSGGAVEEALDSGAGLPTKMRPISRRGHGRRKDSLRSAVAAFAVLVLATVGTAASPRHSAFVSPSTGFMPSRLGSSKSGAHARSLRCAPTSPLLRMETKLVESGDKMEKIARTRLAGSKRLLGSRRLARALAALLVPPETLEVDDAKVLWSRRIALAVGSFSTDPASLAAASSSATTFPTTDAAWSSSPIDAGDALLQGAPTPPATSPSILSPSIAGGGGAQVRTGPPLLPELSEEDLVRLGEGRRVQRQTRSGRVGTGMVVVDVAADVDTCLSVLTDVDRYPERISTVREAITYECGDRLRKTQFQLSRFRLQINTELRCEKERNLLSFKMDPQRPALFLNQADGFWHLQDMTTAGMAPKTRVWLVASISCSPVLPTSMVDYAAARALPRATKWLRPVMEEMASSLPPLSPMCQSECEVELGDAVELGDRVR